jgi:hypothetical protein
MIEKSITKKGSSNESLIKDVPRHTKIKRIIIFIVTLTVLCASPGIAQRQGGQRSVSPQRVGITGRAAQSWRTFYSAFRLAVRRRDRAALRRMMINEFTFSFGDEANASEAFAHFDNPNNYTSPNGRRRTGWTVLDQVLARGVRPDVDNMRSGTYNPSYIASGGNIGCRAGFEFVGGRWRWTYFVCGD